MKGLVDQVWFRYPYQILGKDEDVNRNHDINCEDDKIRIKKIRIWIRIRIKVKIRIYENIQDWNKVN